MAADGANNRLKVSRQGLDLIKSFEGFRPRAERLDDGRWVIGHGHTLSAREGASVTLEDAELLLHYDLLPVLEAIGRHVTAPLNAHQVDALASFGLSVGAEALAQSEVLSLLNDARPEAAAEALARAGRSPAHAPPPDPLVRRRAAEGALFGRDPDRALDLAELLTAPVPETPEAAPARDARAEALAHLLGESDVPSQDVPCELIPDVVIPVFAAPFANAPAAEDARLQPANENVAAMPGAGALAGADETESGQESDPEFAPESDPTPVQEPDQESDMPPSPAPTPVSVSASLALRRYAPYGVAPGGPLPDMPAATAVEASAHEEGGEADPDPEPEPDSAPGPDLGAEPEATEPVADASEPDHAVQPDAPELEPQVAAPAVNLILTPPNEEEVEAPAREAWPDSARPGPALDEEPLFIDDPAMRLGAVPVFRPEGFDPAPRGRIDWSDTGAFIGMGGVGLAAFGAAIIGFRMAAERSASTGIDQTAIVAWVLALIGALCVGVSAYNLTRRWRRGPEA